MHIYMESLEFWDRDHPATAGALMAQANIHHHGHRGLDVSFWAMLQRHAMLQ